VNTVSVKRTECDLVKVLHSDVEETEPAGSGGYNWSRRQIVTRQIAALDCEREAEALLHGNRTSSE
jgi:hypothetical protein